MTETVQEVTSTKPVDNRLDNKGASGKKAGIKHCSHGSYVSVDEPADDTVDISDEARKRADGTWKKSILEYVENE